MTLKPAPRVLNRRAALSEGLFSVEKIEDKSPVIEGVDEASAWKAFLEQAHAGQRVRLLRGGQVLAEVRWNE